MNPSRSSCLNSPIMPKSGKRKKFKVNSTSYKISNGRKVGPANESTWFKEKKCGVSNNEMKDKLRDNRVSMSRRLVNQELS